LDCLPGSWDLARIPFSRTKKIITRTHVGKKRNVFLKSTLLLSTETPRQVRTSCRCGRFALGPRIISALSRRRNLKHGRECFRCVPVDHRHEASRLASDHRVAIHFKEDFDGPTLAVKAGMRKQTQHPCCPRLRDNQYTI